MEFLYDQHDGMFFNYSPLLHQSRPYLVRMSGECRDLVRRGLPLADALKRTGKPVEADATKDEESIVLNVASEPAASLPPSSASDDESAAKPTISVHVGGEDNQILKEQQLADKFSAQSIAAIPDESLLEFLRTEFGEEAADVWTGYLDKANDDAEKLGEIYKLLREEIESRAKARNRKATNFVAWRKKRKAARKAKKTEETK